MMRLQRQKEMGLTSTPPSLVFLSWEIVTKAFTELSMAGLMNEEVNEV
jgi:hypothetical protein